MNPDQIIVLYVLRNRFGKKAIGVFVCIPSRFVESDLAGVVVKERP